MLWVFGYIMKLQIDLPEDLNTKLKLYKVVNKFKTLQEAMIDVLEIILNFDEEILVEAFKMRQKKQEDKSGETLKTKKEE